jgi:hypothetical protein
MKLNEAYHILGVSRDSEFALIKKKYRELIRLAHPDSGGVLPAAFYDAHEINTAYALIKKSFTDKTPAHEQNKHKEPEKEIWNAPLNQYAYVEREILQYAEDYDGTVIGNFCIAKGKYMWTVEEEFPLFLLSIYKSSRNLLLEAEKGLACDVSDATRNMFQPKLAYLLAEQFIDGSALLKKLAKEVPPKEPSDDMIYYVPAMLESGILSASVKAGDALIPSHLVNHRLYLKHDSGKEVGYLSFADDRLYYVVIPMFEQRAVKIKIRVADGKNKLHVWLKYSDETCTMSPENLNLQIEELLDKYRAKLKE